MSIDNIFIWNIKKDKEKNPDNSGRELRVPSPKRKDLPEDKDNKDDSANKDDNIVEDFIIDFNI